MKIRLSLTLIAVFLSSVVWGERSATSITIDSLLIQLNKSIDNNQSYLAIRESRIDSLTTLLGQKNEPRRMFDLYMQLFELTRPYVSDQAVNYLNRGLELSQQFGWKDEAVRVKCRLAYTMSSIGLYKEADDILSSIKRSEVTDANALHYFEAQVRNNGEVAVYTMDEQLRSLYWGRYFMYRDSLFAVIDSTSDVYLDFHENRVLHSGDAAGALEVNDRRMERHPPKSALYPVICFSRAFIYDGLGDKEGRLEWLVRSAISDVENAVTDNGSLWLVAEELNKRGDIKNAYRFITYAYANAVKYNARLRLFQNTNLQAIIERRYQEQVAQAQTVRTVMLVVLSIMSVLLLIAFFVLLRQMKSLARVHHQRKEVNALLNEVNEELALSNKIKEVYIAHFLTLYSGLMDRFIGYTKQVDRKVQSGHIEELKKLLVSDVANANLAQFYKEFDITFLSIFPDFVARFNELLLPDEQIVLKAPSQLTPELRIFALVRLGINDSARIARLLRYSCNTIYNYRAQVKNKASIDRHEFENMIMKIGLTELTIKHERR